MRSKHIPMTREEFEVLPMELGWKYEYWDGRAHISPRPQVVTITIGVKPRPVRSLCKLRPVAEANERQLVSAYLAAFRDTVEYCDWEAGKIEASANETIQDFFAGKRGKPLPASRVAVDSQSEADGGKIIGAALVVESTERRPLLDLLFVMPHWQRRGIATAVVVAALNELHAAGMQTLESRYVLGNEESRGWHQKFGFVEVPDLLLARAHYRHAQHELWRLEKMGGLTEADRTMLSAERDRWNAQVEELEAIADQQGIEAVLPGLRHR